MVSNRRNIMLATVLSQQPDMSRSRAPVRRRPRRSTGLGLVWVSLLLVVVVVALVAVHAVEGARARQAAPTSPPPSKEKEPATDPVCEAFWREARAVLDEHSMLKDPTRTASSRGAYRKLMTRFDNALAALNATPRCMRHGEGPAHRLMHLSIVGIQKLHNRLVKHLLSQPNVQGGGRTPGATANLTTLDSVGPAGASSVMVVTKATTRQHAQTWMYNLLDRLVDDARRREVTTAATAAAETASAASDPKRVRTMISEVGPVMLGHPGDGLMPIHLAVQMREHQVLETLLNADLEGTAAALAAPASSDFGLTPLHLAVVNADAAAALELLRAGAPLGARDEFGRTPRYVAETLGYDNIVALLDLWAAGPAAGWCPRPEATAAGPHRHMCPAPRWTFSPSARLPSGLRAPMPASDRWCPFPRMHSGTGSQKLDEAVFMRDFVSIRRPLILKGDLATWQVLSTWQPSVLATRFGERRLRAGRIPYGELFAEEDERVTLGRYQAYLDGLVPPVALPSPPGRPDLPNPPAPLPSALPTYIFDNELTTADREFFDPNANLFPAAFTPLLKLCSQFPVAHQFFYGPALSGAPHHFHGDAVNVVVRGRKRWLLLPPSSAVYTKVHPALEPFWSDFAGVRGWPSPAITETLDTAASLGPDPTNGTTDIPYVCTQEAGDILYLPVSWGHSTLNEADTIGFAVEFNRWGW